MQGNTTVNILAEIKQIVESGMREAYLGVNTMMVYTYWKVGRRIVEEEQNGKTRAAYGTGLLNYLSAELSKDYPKSFTDRDLRNYRQLYLCFNDLEIWYARVPNLTWTHYRSLLRVTDDNARYWCLREASREMWSSRTLDRNIGSQYYCRLIQSPSKEEVVAEMKQLTAAFQSDKLEMIKSPVVAEFLQLPQNASFTEEQVGTSYHHTFEAIPIGDGTWLRLYVRAVPHQYRYGRLLHRFGFLQCGSEMLFLGGFENDHYYPSRCRPDGYVC